jgi:rubrerythrin
MASTSQLLEKAERLELLAAEVYRALAGRFAGEGRALFLRLADEELQHASRIRLLAARLRHDRRLAAAVAADTAALDTLLAEARRVVDEVVRGGWDGDLEGALRRAGELELRFVAAHAQSLARGAHPELRAFFEQLAAQDAAHARLLGP